MALTLAAACLLAGTAALAEDAGAGALQLIRLVTTTVIEELKAQRDMLRDDPRRLDEFVDQLIVPHFDFERMSRRVLGKRWKTAAPEQQSRFVAVFRSLLVRTYASVLNEYTDQTMTYLDPIPRKKDNEIVIPLQVAIAGGQPIQVAYAMIRRGSEWKVFDVAIDGVSLVTNYRSSFRSEIARHGIDGLIARLEAKASETN